MNQRVITGGILGALILLCIYAGNKYTSQLLMVINIFGAYELSKLLRPHAPRIVPYLHIVLAVTPYLVLRYFDVDGSLFNPSVYIAVAVGILSIISIYKNGYWPYNKMSFYLATFYWGLSLSLGAYYLYTHAEASNLIALGVILLIWTSDTMAYFVGKRFGSRKLFERVSPNKTWEGSLGAGAFIVLTSCLLGYLSGQSISSWIAIGLVTWIAGTYGDLFESKIKRSVNAKDSGTLLPGHGGFLDRFDSLVMVIPFLLLLTLIF